MSDKKINIRKVKKELKLADKKLLIEKQLQSVRNNEILRERASKTLIILE